jgi:hypothetical protein
MQWELSAWKLFIVKRCTIKFVKFTESSSKIKIHIFPHFISLLYSRHTALLAYQTWPLDTLTALSHSWILFSSSNTSIYAHCSASASAQLDASLDEREARARRDREEGEKWELYLSLSSEWEVSGQREAWGVSETADLFSEVRTKL